MAAAHRPSDILNLVTLSPSPAASAFVPALVLGIFWRKATRAGAVAGMLAGLVVAAGYTLMACVSLAAVAANNAIHTVVVGHSANIQRSIWRTRRYRNPGRGKLFTQPATQNQPVRTLSKSDSLANGKPGFLHAGILFEKFLLLPR